MKNNRILLTLFLCGAMLCLLTGCVFGKVYEKPDAFFRADNFGITLTDGFFEREYEGYHVCYESAEAAVFVVREEYSVFEALGYDDISFEEYTDLVYEENNKSYPSTLRTVDGATVMTYEYTSDSRTYSYCSFICEGGGAFWIVSFMCEDDNYFVYEPYFYKWAESVKFYDE